MKQLASSPWYGQYYRLGKWELCRFHQRDECQKFKKWQDQLPHRRRQWHCYGIEWQLQGKNYPQLLKIQWHLHKSHCQNGVPHWSWCKGTPHHCWPRASDQDQWCDHPNRPFDLGLQYYRRIEEPGKCNDRNSSTSRSNHDTPLFDKVEGGNEGRKFRGSTTPRSQPSNSSSGRDPDPQGDDGNSPNPLSWGRCHQQLVKQPNWINSLHQKCNSCLQQLPSCKWHYRRGKKYHEVALHCSQEAHQQDKIFGRAREQGTPQTCQPMPLSLHPPPLENVVGAARGSIGADDSILC